MMRAHCDRCDAPVEGAPSWIEDNESKLDARGGPMTGAGVNPIWHVVIHAGGQVPCEEKMFCLACRIVILEKFVQGCKVLLPSP